MHSFRQNGYSMGVEMNRAERYRNFIGSDDWEIIRKAKLRQSGKKCEKCGLTKNLQVHHLDYGNELEFVEDDDLMVVCADCHNILHQDIECFN